MCILTWGKMMHHLKKKTLHTAVCAPLALQPVDKCTAKLWFVSSPCFSPRCAAYSNGAVTVVTAPYTLADCHSRGWDSPADMTRNCHALSSLPLPTHSLSEKKENWRILIDWIVPGLKVLASVLIVHDPTAGTLSKVPKVYRSGSQLTLSLWPVPAFLGPSFILTSTSDCL